MRVKYFLPLAAFLLVVAFMAWMLGRTPQFPALTMRDQPLPALSLPPLESDVAELDLRTVERPFMINLFASWCAPCLAEHPVLMAAREAGIPIYGIAYKDEWDNIRKWLETHGNPFEVVLLDVSGQSGITLGVGGVPETLLVDREGIIRARYAGPLSEDAFRQAILPLWQGLAADEAS